jgi:2-C-methyl-D-erythritol 4-phosphate cytidylyltransferase
VTDDTAACELIGQPVSLVESDSWNPKVTVVADLALVAGAFGYSACQFGRGRLLWSLVSSEL